MRCPKCRSEADEKYDFCSNCGSKLNEEVDVSEEIKVSEEVEVNEEELEEEPYEDLKPGKEPKRLNMITVYTLLSISVVLLGLSLFFFINKNTHALEVSNMEMKQELTLDDDIKEIEEIHIVNSEILLLPGQTQKVKFYTYPANADISELIWESSNDSIKITGEGYVNSAQVNTNGVVNVKNKDGQVYASCNIKVLSEEEAFYSVINLINEDSYNDNKYIDFKAEKMKLVKQILNSRTEESISVFDKINKELPSYMVSQKELINEKTNNKIDCDVYMESTNKDIRKIVTIEYLNDSLEITDYYFLEGKIYFIFKRQENYYRPIAAQQDFPGSRYYFMEDSLTKWREIIQNPDQLFNKTDYYYLEDGFTWKTYEYKDLSNVEIEKKDYIRPAESRDLKEKMESEYKQRQKDMLNSAYNLYEKILQIPNITELKGYVVDQEGSPMFNAHIKVFSDDYQMLVGETKTQQDGGYALKVPVHNKPYRVEISKEGYVETTIYNIDTSLNTNSLFQENIYMYRSGQSYYTIRLNLIDALEGQNVNDAKVIIRSGINNRSGAVVKEFDLKEYYINKYNTGIWDDYYYDVDYYYDDYYVNDYTQFYDVQLYPGNYTVEVKSPGYNNTYFTLSTIRDGWEVYSSVVQEVKDNQVRIVLSWGENPRDLDSHLFFPDSQHIGYYNRQVSNSFLDRDDTDSYGPETITIDNLGDGTYKFYVADYINCSYGNYNSTEMSNSSARVDVYNKNGLIESFNVPTNRNGVIWHVFNISNKKIIPVQRYYNNIEDMKWWTSYKFY